MVGRKMTPRMFKNFGEYYRAFHRKKKKSFYHSALAQTDHHYWVSSIFNLSFVFRSFLRETKRDFQLQVHVQTC